MKTENIIQPDEVDAIGNFEMEHIEKGNGLDKLQPDDVLQINDFMLLQRVIKKTNSILEQKELLKHIVQDVSQTLGFTRCAVLLYDEDTDQLEISALTGWEDKTFYPGFKISKNHGIVWEAIRKQKIIYIPDVLDFPEETRCDFTSRSHLDIPMYHHNKIIGILNAQSTTVGAFSVHDLRLLETLASYLSIAIENSRLFEIEKREKETILTELREAKEIQSRLFPKHSPVVPNFKITGLCEPCNEVGGDWYDYIKLPSGKVGVVLADVAGKGLSAAFLMSSARSIFRIIAGNEESPSEVLKKVNNYLIEDLPAAKFITMIYLVIDPYSRKIILSNAGHLWPMLKSKDDVKQLKFTTGLPLGIQYFDYRDNEFFLEANDKLFLYSDGVSEAMNINHHFFDQNILNKSLKKENADFMTIYNDVKSFIGKAPQNDDITIVEIGVSEK